MPFDITFSSDPNFDISIDESSESINADFGEVQIVPYPGPKGDDGFSPVVEVSEITGGHEVSVTDATGTHTFDVMDGADGQPGRDGADGKPGADGKDGENGKDGKDGADGHDGTNGTDGVSPVANVSKTGNTATITITDAIGTTTATVTDGTNGTNGQNGKSAYQYAVDGGYTGTEQEFATKLATEYLTTEADPTVPAWAKAENKPTYTATEVGALPSSTVIPTKTSDLNNDSGYITGMYIASYGSSTWGDVLAAYNANKVVYCRASSNANPGTGTQGRMAFLAYVGFSGSSPSSFEFQYYRSVNGHSDSQQGDQVFIYTLKSTGWTVITREAYTKIVAGTGLTSTYSNGVLTIKLA